MTTQNNQVSVDENTRKVARSSRLDGFGWAALLIAVGTIWLLPEKQVPRGSWLIAVGLILLGLNAIRYFIGIKMVGFSLIAGILALLAGFGEFLGLKLPLFAIALIVIGLVMLIKPLLEKNPIPTVGQDWRCCGPGEHENNQDTVQGQAVGR